MTPREDRGTSARRPDVDELAELDAGLLDEHTARTVRAAAEADPAARDVLAALAATRATLAALPDPPVPPEVAARWSAALRETALRESALRESAGGETAVGETGRGERRAADPRPATAPPGRRPPHTGRRALWRRPAVLAGAALLVVLVLAALLGRGRDQVAVDGATLVQQSLSSRGLHDTGVFEEPARRSSCLAALRPPGVTAAAPLLGGRQVTFEGRDGVLLLLGTGRLGVFDAVVVDPACSTLLASRRIGG